MLRALLIIAAIGILMALMGWISFSNSGDHATITLEKQEVQKDTETAVNKVKELGHDLGQKAEQAFDGNKAPATSEPVAPVTNP